MPAEERAVLRTGGASRRPTSAGGGEGAPSQFEPVYHTPEDTISNNVSPQRPQVSLELIGSAAYKVARHR
jgi:hypothetical protein